MRNNQQLSVLQSGRGRVLPLAKIRVIQLHCKSKLSPRVQQHTNIHMAQRRLGSRHDRVRDRAQEHQEPNRILPSKYSPEDSEGGVRPNTGHLPGLAQEMSGRSFAN